MYRKVSYNNDEDDPVIQLDSYNQQYSLIIQLAKQFLQDAKQAIHKYLQKTKFPTYLNKGIVSKWAVNFQESLNDPDRFNVKKERQFSEILVHLKRNIHEMIQFEKTFKKQFQDSVKKSSKDREYKKMKSSVETTECSKFEKTSIRLLDESKSSFNNTEEEEVASVVTNTNKEDEKLRKQLRMIVLPKVINIEVEKGKEENNTSEIIDRIESKINKMKLVMNKERQREEKILNIFDTQKIVVPDIDTESPGITDLLKQIQELKSTIQQKDQTIRFFENRMAAIDNQSIVVERYTIPKSQKLIGNLQDMGGVPLSLNFSFTGMNSPRSPLLVDTGFKKKDPPNSSRVS